MQNGTTAAVLDPHDAVNVLGHKGAKYLMEEMKETELTPVWMASPCVPSAPGYEDCYGQVMLQSDGGRIWHVWNCRSNGL